MEQKLGLDLGYGDVKGKTENKLFKFPSAVAIKNEDFTDFGNNNSNETFTYNGRKYLIGDMALDKAITTRGFNFLEKHTSLLAYKAIKMASFNTNKPITINTGLSLINWKDRENFVKNLLEINVNNEIIKCKVNLMAQGEGIFIDYNGDKNGLVAIADVGFNTLDFLVFYNSVPRADLSFSTRGGANIIITKLQSMLQRKYDYDISEQMAKDIFIKGSFKIFGDTIDVKDEIEDSKTFYVEQILDEIKNKRLDIVRKANKVIFGGGGAYFLENTKLPKNALLCKKPYEFANVRGYYNGR